MWQSTHLSVNCLWTWQKILITCLCCYSLILQNYCLCYSSSELLVLHDRWNDISQHFIMYVASICCVWGFLLEQHNFLSILRFPVPWPLRWDFSLPLPLPERPLLHGKTALYCINFRFVEFCNRTLAANSSEWSEHCPNFQMGAYVSSKFSVLQTVFLFYLGLNCVQFSQPQHSAFYATAIVSDYCNAQTVKCSTDTNR